MSWFGLDKLFTGYSSSELQAQSDALDAQMAAKNQELADAGYITQDQVAAAQANMVAGNISTGASDVAASMDAGFVEGAQQGLNNVLDAPGKVVGAVGDAAGQLGWGILKNIPWWVWIGGAIALFIWMGGGELLAGMLKGRLKRI
jgi:hypothetical protein